MKEIQKLNLKLDIYPEFRSHKLLNGKDFKPKYLLEIIVTNTREAILAEKYGAGRLELIHAFQHGGLSPDLELSRQVCSAVKIPVNIMLRPHAMGFTYTNRDKINILEQLAFLRDHTKANGIVFGALTHNYSLDEVLLQQIIELKQHLNLTFHRAIDASNNPLQIYKQLLKFKDINHVLTSGGKPTAIAGCATIRQMLALNPEQKSSIIIAGSGITPTNYLELIKNTGITHIHLGRGVRNQDMELSLTKLRQFINVR